MTLTKSDKITLAICLVILFCIGAKVAIDTKQAKAQAIKSVQSQNAEPNRTEPNYSEIITEKYEQIKHWQSMCRTLEKRNAENVKEFERQYKKLEKKK